MHFPNGATKITTFTVFAKLETNVPKNIRVPCCPIQALEEEKYWLPITTTRDEPISFVMGNSSRQNQIAPLALSDSGKLTILKCLQLTRAKGWASHPLFS